MSQLVTQPGTGSQNAAVNTGLLRIPASASSTVEIRFASLENRDCFDPQAWRRELLKPSFERESHYEIDLDLLNLPDGDYEYEFVIDGRLDQGVPDPYAEELTKFGGYRGVFRIREGRRWRRQFSWDDEFPPGVTLANNHQLVIYEMPMRWMDTARNQFRQVGLGTFERAVFMRLDQIADLGINAIELLPVQDSPDTLNWGYGTRFFFAPDFDMGTPVDLKFFVKQCHRRGIRVLFDVVMNHDGDCPLRRLDFHSYFLERPEEEPGRGPDWGGKLFRYRPRDRDDATPAREFQFAMAEFLINEYHADGFRIDEFRGIDNWEFVQEFRDRAWSVHQRRFPGRPFLVIAEDSWRRAQVAQEDENNPNGRKVTDAIWNFSFRDEVRRMFRNGIDTQWGEPARRERVRSLVSGAATWDQLSRSSQRGFYDMSQAVNYLTSHDVEDEHEKRITNYLMGPLLKRHGLGHTLPHVRWVSDHAHADAAPAASELQIFLHGLALERVRSCFALLLTSVGVPMILAGDEFGDVHDLDHTDYRLKMSDPVDWGRRDQNVNNRRLWEQVRRMIHVRREHPALLRNEVEFFHFHPSFDDNQGSRVFAYCRTGGMPLGAHHQIVAVANVGEDNFGDYYLPWFWNDWDRIAEFAAPGHHVPLSQSGDGGASLSLAPFQVRVFRT